jgi:hypothetical protein
MKRSFNLAILILGTFAVLVILTHAADYFSQIKTALPLFYPLYLVDAKATLASVGSLAEVINSLFGIIITVVAIIVNLSANRYTQKIIDIFIREKINIVILSLFSIASLYGIWIINSIQSWQASDYYTPRIQILFYLFLISVSILVIVPYFYYVFQFLRPENIISKIKKQTIDSLKKASKLKNRPHKIEHIEKTIKPKIIENLNQLTEICKSSVKEADQSLALSAVTTLNDILKFYIDAKESHLKSHARLPYHKEWYLEIDPYFLGINRPIIDELKIQKYWFEYKILQEFESIFVYSFEKDSKMAYQTAINFTDVSKVCVGHKDFIFFHYIVRYFNTLLKACIVQLDVQNTIYVFYQYYLACKYLIDNYKEEYEEDEKNLVVNVAEYFKIYGQMGQQKGLDKVLESSAYFLRLINEAIYMQFSKIDMDFIETLLDIFLTVDNITEGKDVEKALLGVRQQQTLLAGFYLYNNSPLLADQIYSDMKEENIERIQSIVDSIMEVDENRYFEIDNIGINPLFTLEHYKRMIKRFYKMFIKGEANE